ncbi:alcohol dehydrogenase catalytic domain-containing protein [Pseudonocardia xinjiangensis]|uniref:alcohol dehydrogenase catalytic domain-containing protein n=1 Tax=Pseudonocardia xinjiangensis TaxID=75289 RepID=UPI003D942508
MHAAGVNPAGWEARANGWGRAVPHILGFDMTGVVEAVGFGATRYRPGDELFGMPEFPRPTPPAGGCLRRVSLVR